MSKEHLVEAYLSGELSRRRFIRGLIAAGVSTAAAGAYAQISPELAHATDSSTGPGKSHYDHYDHYDPRAPRHGRRRRRSPP